MPLHKEHIGYKLHVNIRCDQMSAKHIQKLNTENECFRQNLSVSLGKDLHIHEPKACSQIVKSNLYV